MRIDILTLFPDSVGDVLSDSILGRAQDRGILRIEAHQIRDYTANKQNQVDDYPYGGGRGAVMTADPLYRCWEAVCDQAGGPVHTIYLSPCGKTFKQEDAIRLSKMDNLVFVCGHYEGIDQRFIDECVDEELSLGDFVLTGGEIAAMAMTDAICRMVPGVLADPECFEDESHFNGLLEYPQYSRPAVWHGREVPQILLSGNHEKVRQWRRKQSLRRTRERRPDMYAALDLSSKQDKKLLKEMEDEDNVLLLKQWVAESKRIVFFGGAGVSTESGIPDFRSVDGLYNQKFEYPPETIISHSFYLRDPEYFFRFYKDKMLPLDFEPNISHKKLAQWEQEGKLTAVITQNIDGLHQKAGSKKVLELHGSVHRNYCQSCGKFYDGYYVRDCSGVPTCSCGGSVKPDVVLYEEPLDGFTMREAVNAISQADLLIVAGTSLAVYPAASLIDYYNADRLVLINKSKTPYDHKANMVLHCKLGEIFSEL